MKIAQNIGTKNVFLSFFLEAGGGFGGVTVFISISFFKEK